MTDKTIRVGVGVIALNEKNQFLMAKRKNTHWEGRWAVPGGHIEFGETFEQAAIRETLVETGLMLAKIRILGAATHFFNDREKHFVAVYCIGRVTGQPCHMEPHKSEEWNFFDDWNDLPQPLFVDYLNDVRPEDIFHYINNRNIDGPEINSD